VVSPSRQLRRRVIGYPKRPPEATIDNAGFEFRHCLAGRAPIVCGLPREPVLAVGDLVDCASGCAAPASAGGRALVGVVIDIDDRRAWVIANADAVYAVYDPHPRDPATPVALTGGSGDHGVTDDDDGELEVVTACTTDEPTLVRIRAGRHHALALAATEGEGADRLSLQDERRLVAAAVAGDGVAGDVLIEALRPAIAAIARERAAAPADLGTLLPRGEAGARRALARYDPTLGTPFWGYAAWWVGEAMTQASAPDGPPARLSRPRRLADGLPEPGRRILAEHYGLGCPARPLDEIGAELGVGADRVRVIEEQALEQLRAAAGVAEA
jgi:sigma-70-like protein